MGAQNNSQKPDRGSGLTKLTAAAAVAFLALLLIIPSYAYPEIGRELASHFIWTLALVIFVVLVTLYPYRRNVNDTFEFFGIKGHNPSVSIYLSNMLVRPKGTLALEKTEKGYVGPAISKVEYEAALRIQRMIMARPIAVLPDKVQEWIGHLVFKIERAEVQIRISPREFYDPPAEDYGWNRMKGTIDRYLGDGTIVILGSGIYNSIAKWYQDHHLADPDAPYHSYFQVASDNDGRRLVKKLTKGSEAGQELRRGEARETGSITQFVTEPAFIMRLSDKNKIIFMCTGIAAWSTAASVLFLLENWKDLHAAFKESDFGVALRCRFPQNFSDNIETIKPAQEEFRFFLRGAT
jgi:hypothetical protein